MKRVIFDLDGTLVDSAPDIQASVNLMLSEEGLAPLDLATVVAFVGNGLPTLVKRVMAHCEISAAEFDRLSARVLAIYNASSSKNTVVYEGVIHTLDALRQRGMSLAVCTNKPEAPARHVLDAMGLGAFFDTVVGGDTLAKSKPDALPLLTTIGQTPLEEVLFVGDSEVDAETARNAGARFALFTEGYRKSPVSKIAHDVQFSNWRDFVDLV